MKLKFLEEKDLVNGKWIDNFLSIYYRYIDSGEPIIPTAALFEPVFLTWNTNLLYSHW